MYLIYDKSTKTVVDIVNTITDPFDDNYGYVQNEAFNLDDIENYDIWIREDNSVFSQIKSLAERKAIKLEKENQQLGIELSEREIQEIIQGIQISELEIQLLELQLGGM